MRKLFEIFNLKHPKDFLCASLSVGNIIAIHKEEKLKAYYVNPVGFSKLPDFFGEAESLTSKCPICGNLSEPGEKLCGRCLLLQNLLEKYPTMEGISIVFWDHCFACESEIIASVNYFLLTNQKTAMRLFREKQPVYLVFPGEGELLTMSKKAIEEHKGPFATDRACWFTAMQKAA